MKNLNMKKSTLRGMTFLTGMAMLLFLLSNLEAADRRSLRGSRPTPTTSTPGSAGGVDPLGTDPTRPETGKPDPHGGAGEPSEPEVDDPFKNENGGAGEPGKEKPTVQGMPARRPNRSNK